MESAGLVACSISPAVKLPVPPVSCWVVEVPSVKLALEARVKAFEAAVVMLVHPALVQVFPLARRYSSRVLRPDIEVSPI